MVYELERVLRVCNQSINQVYFQINMYKNEQKVHISQIDRKKVEVEVNNL